MIHIHLGFDLKVSKKTPRSRWDVCKTAKFHRAIAEVICELICLVVWNIFLFLHILGIVTPTDELHHFSEG